jgi:hypothetical protein
MFSSGCSLTHFYSSFVVIKVILGVNLISYATRRRDGMEARAAEDAINDFGRDPVGEGKEEQVWLSNNLDVFSANRVSCRNTTRS